MKQTNGNVGNRKSANNEFIKHYPICYNAELLFVNEDCHINFSILALVIKMYGLWVGKNCKCRRATSPVVSLHEEPWCQNVKQPRRYL